MPLSPLAVNLCHCRLGQGLVAEAHQLVVPGRFPVRALLERLVIRGNGLCRLPLLKKNETEVGKGGRSPWGKGERPGKPLLRLAEFSPVPGEHAQIVVDARIPRGQATGLLVGGKRLRESPLFPVQIAQGDMGAGQGWIRGNRLGKGTGRPVPKACPHLLAGKIVQ